MLKTYLWPLLLAMFVTLASFASAQVSRENAVSGEKEHEHQMQSDPASLSAQVRELSRQVSELASKLKEQGVDAASMKAHGDERRRNMSMGISGGTMQAQPMPPNTQAMPGPAPQMGMMAGMMSMMNSMMGGMGASAPMGQAASMGPGSFLSVLPGFPGASHLYHIGSTNFFLDHPQHITLSLEQQNRLGEIQMNALMRRGDLNRKIQEVEEQIWILTASDQPNFSSIEAKVRESEKLQGDFRLAFIKDVGEAAKILTDEQRKALLGTLSAQVQVAPPISTPDSQPMGDM